MKRNTWLKSSRSNPSGNCVEAFWKTSSKCANGTCVEVKGAGDSILVRDTKLGDGGPVLTFPADDWRMFIAEIQAGEVSPGANFVRTSRVRGGWMMEDVRDAGRGDHLTFTPDEWDAFVVGAEAGEFDLTD